MTIIQLGRIFITLFGLAGILLCGWNIYNETKAIGLTIVIGITSLSATTVGIRGSRESIIDAIMVMALLLTIEFVT